MPIGKPQVFQTTLTCDFHLKTYILVSSLRQRRLPSNSPTGLICENQPFAQCSLFLVTSGSPLSLHIHLEIILSAVTTTYCLPFLLWLPNFHINSSRSSLTKTPFVVITYKEKPVLISRMPYVVSEIFLQGPSPQLYATPCHLSLNQTLLVPEYQEVSLDQFLAIVSFPEFHFS